jgi:hypothetical protein
MATTTFLSNADYQHHARCDHHRPKRSSERLLNHHWSGLARIHSLWRWWPYFHWWPSNSRSVNHLFPQLRRCRSRGNPCFMRRHRHNDFDHRTKRFSPSNRFPEYVLTNCMLASFTPINSTVGELATVEASFTGGTWVRRHRLNKKQHNATNAQSNNKRNHLRSHNKPLRHYCVGTKVQTKSLQPCHRRRDGRFSVYGF